MPLFLRLALRELRGGLTGLRLLAACLFLGVAALSGVGSLSAAILSGLSSRGQELLGGDIEIRLTQRTATPAERAAFAREGQVAEGIRMRAMAGEPGGEDRVLSELKAVDARYPLYGRFRLKDGSAGQGPLQRGEAVIGEALADRLDLRTGDRVELGNASFRIGGVIAEEPDRAGEGFTLGPTVMVALDQLPKTGLIQPGSLLRYHYRLRLPAAAAPEAVTERLQSEFPDAGWQVQDRSNGAPGVRRFVENLGQFLTLVGLTALVVAGVGVGNGVTSYLAGKSVTIASLKSLGADSRLIFRSYLAQVGLIALASVAAGAAVGALVPWLIVLVAGSALPVPPDLSIYPRPLLVGAGYGVLTALAFALLPLARARALPAARLFRATVERAGSVGWRTWALTAIAAAAIAALAVAQAEERMFAALFVAAAAGLLLLLTLLAAAVRWLAARAPRPKSMIPRLALANLHRPGAMTRQLVVALGLGLTLFATLAVIETNLTGQIERTVPDTAPTFFALDIPTGEIEAFTALIERLAPGAELRTVPSLRGPVTHVNGVPSAQVKATEEGWILRGDRGLTYSAAIPPGNRVVEGQWWPEGYAGPPLVSMDAEAARGVGVGVGDTVTVSILGVEITATIANLREVDWDSMGFNFVFVFAPGTLENAPHSYMATATVEPANERAVYRATSRAFPTASVIRIKEVVGAVGDLFGQLSVAVRAAASVTVAAGIAVLVGALAASRQARIYDAVLLKVLGATRGQVMAALLIEYGILALIVAGLAFGLGAAGGWYVVTEVLDLEWQPDWLPVIATVLIGGATTVLLALALSWRSLSVRPNRALRSL